MMRAVCGEYLDRGCGFLTRPPCRDGSAPQGRTPGACAASAAARSGAALSTPGMGDRLGVKVPWRKRWC
jgi:hypothetical protein